MTRKSPAHPHSPGPLIAQNSELRDCGAVFNWTIPAFVVRLSDGTRFNACPSAGRCTRVCYALFGKYLFTPVRARHLANLEYVLNHPDEFEDQMLAELVGPRFDWKHKVIDLPHDESNTWLNEWMAGGGAALRIHDGGDFFAEWYLEMWIRIARKRPHVLFYAYTKSVSMVLPYLDRMPVNMVIIFSYGGLEDHLIDRENHRHSDVFPSRQSIEDAGYLNQESNDLLAAVAPTNKIGVPANNIPTALKRFDGHRMSEINVRGGVKAVVADDDGTEVEVTITRKDIEALA